MGDSIGWTPANYLVGGDIKHGKRSRVFFLELLEAYNWVETTQFDVGSIAMQLNQLFNPVSLHIINVVVLCTS